MDIIINREVKRRPHLLYLLCYHRVSSLEHCKVLSKCHSEEYLKGRIVCKVPQSGKALEIF